MLELILVFVALLVIGILVYAARQPDDYRVERTTTVDAPREVIFPLVNDLHNWSQWSPFEALDPDMRKTFSGPESGKGAAFEWEGNRKAGQGRMEIIESVPPSLVRVDLQFLKPFKSQSISEFTFEEEADATRVTWAMLGKYTFATKVMCIFMSMDDLVGKDFTRGLAKMKQVAEQPVAGGM